MDKIDKKKIVKRILIKIKPEIKSVINNRKINLINSGLIDSFDIIRIIVEINKIKKKEIDPSKVNKSTLLTINSNFGYYVLCFKSYYQQEIY